MRPAATCLCFLPPHPHPNSQLLGNGVSAHTREASWGGGGGEAVVYLRFCSWEKPRSLCQKCDSLSIMCPGGMQIKVARGSHSRLGAFLWRSCAIRLLSRLWNLQPETLLRPSERSHMYVLHCCWVFIYSILCFASALWRRHTERKVCEPGPLVPAQTGH